MNKNVLVCQQMKVFGFHKKDNPRTDENENIAAQDVIQVQCCAANISVYYNEGASDFFRIERLFSS